MKEVSFMTIYKYIQSKIEELEGRKYSHSDFAKHQEEYDFCHELKKMDKDITLQDFCDAMEFFHYCPATFTPDHTCNMTEYFQGCCHMCWREYLQKRLQPFQNLTFYKVLHNSEETNKKIDKIRSAEYLEWIYSFFSNPNTKVMSSEVLAYSDNKVDEENSSLLHLFNLYIEDLAEENDECQNLADNSEYEATKYLFKIKDKCFAITVVVGQGSIIYVEEIENTEHGILVL